MERGKNGGEEGSKSVEAGNRPVVFHDSIKLFQSEVLAPHVERGEEPGLVALVAREDRVDVHAPGVKTLSKAGTVERDTIFRIEAMTKPVAQPPP